MELQMERRGIPQELLKGLACVTMAMDHVGAALVSAWVPWLWLRGIGRVAFPIFCFLLVEGYHHTKNVNRYMDRMLIAALISELPFDLALFEGIDWGHQNVMFTFLLGLLAMETMRHIEDPMWKLLSTLPMMAAAEWLFCTDYGDWGVALIVLLELTYQPSKGRWMQYAAIALVCAMMPSYRISIGGMKISLEMFGAAALLPLLLYSGKRLSASKTVQWGFYLFYPAHLAVIWLISLLR